MNTTHDTARRAKKQDPEQQDPEQQDPHDRVHDPVLRAREAAGAARALKARRGDVDLSRCTVILPDGRSASVVDAGSPVLREAAFLIAASFAGMTRAESRRAWAARQAQGAGKGAG